MKQPWINCLAFIWLLVYVVCVDAQRKHDGENLNSLICAVGNGPAACVLSSDADRRDSVDCITAALDTFLCIFDNDLPTYSVERVDDVDSERRARSALDFVTSAYSSNGFYESGSIGSFSRGADKDMFFTGYAADLNIGELYRPVSGPITSRCGFRAWDKRIHCGTDFRAVVNDTVYAALSGRVYLKGFDAAGYGVYLCIVDENGFETRYAHLSSVLVNVGDSVSKGDPLALSGNTGRSTGPHLHFELRYRGKIIDPGLFFR